MTETVPATSPADPSRSPSAISDAKAQSDSPTPYMPEAEGAYVKDAYRKAKVILEYGSGGSTEIASHLPGKYVMSVESSLSWAREMRRKVAGPKSISPVVMYHADIGPTGNWGRPINEENWRNYHHYPNAIWDEPFFRHPDLVLIDGRLRTACLATVMMRATAPVRVLFDDYTVRPRYQLIEQVLKPVNIIGRMAEFEILPNQVEKEDISFLISQYFTINVQGMGEQSYQLDDGKNMPNVSKGNQ